MIDYQYRPEVDGLRAVAIVLVLFYHAGLGLTGGFVGVDVFFVISGFLITGLILKAQEANSFGLQSFWVRRIRRIVPASAGLVFVTLIAGSVLLLPPDLKELADTTVRQQLMISNFYFARHGGYFDGASELKPLLHTWSLAVEEQFYLVYPMLLMFLRRYSKTVVGCLLLGIAVCSFFISEWQVRNAPMTAFYLLPARAWELLLGGLICFLPKPARLDLRLANLLSCGGLGAIMLSATAFDSMTRFPGSAALLPCLGAAVLIYANTIKLTWIGRALAVRPVVFVGLISYSLYLWHWPILAVLRYRLNSELPTSTACLAITASFSMAYLSWRFIETPFRTTTVSSWSSFGSRPRVVFAAAILSGVVLIALSGSMIATDGIKNRFDKQTNAYVAAMNSKKYAHNVTTEQVRSGRLPSFGAEQGPIGCLIWGDSHAMALIPALDATCRKRGIQGVQATRSSTPPLLDFARPNKPNAAEFNQSVVDYILQRHIPLVYIAGFWSGYDCDPDFRNCLSKTVEVLSSQGVRVALVCDVAHQTSHVPRALAWCSAANQDVTNLGIMKMEHMAANQRCNQWFEELANDRVLVLDPVPYLSDECGRLRAEFDGVAMYRDQHHLTIEGALRISPLFDSEWQQRFQASTTTAVRDLTESVKNR